MTAPPIPPDRRMRPLTHVPGWPDAVYVGPASERAARPRKEAIPPWLSGIRRFIGTGALVGVVLVAGALSGCTPASGGTASVSSESFRSHLLFDAAPGRSNSITTSSGAETPWGRPGSLLLTDSRNPVTPGSGCTRVDDHTVRCSVDPTTSIGFTSQRILLGDGNDTYAGSAAVESTTIHAGAGDDAVNGGPSADVIYEDSDAFDRDSFSGGGGGDSVRYAGVLHAVSISLNGIADDGRPGEGDNVKSDVAAISGTGNADVLTGDADDNTIGGPALDDPVISPDQLTGGAVVNGGGGDDQIWGTNWGAADRLSGGAGDDTVYAFAGDDVVSGGPGNDTLWGHAGFDALDGGSEIDGCNLGPDGGTAVNCEAGT